MIVAHIGIDPGSTGAMSIIRSERGVVLDTTSCEFKSKGLDGYIETIHDLGITIQKCVVESVHAMPGQGVTSMFSFGQRLGEITGMLKTFGIGYELVPPQKWQKELGVIKPTASKADRKKAISEKVIAVYPTTGSQIRGPKGGYKDGVADAYGLAHYAFKNYK